MSIKNFENIKIFITREYLHKDCKTLAHAKDATLTPLAMPKQIPEEHLDADIPLSVIVKRSANIDKSNTKQNKENIEV